MGIYHCDCGKTLHGESYGCVTCAYAQGDGNILCEKCTTSATCAACKHKCCSHCESRSNPLTSKCCGSTICGAGKDKKLVSEEHLRKEYGVERDACIWRWNVVEPWTDCGHQRCTACPEACKACSKAIASAKEEMRIEADMGRVALMLADPSTSASLRRSLAAWLGGPAITHGATYSQLADSVPGAREKAKAEMAAAAAAAASAGAAAPGEGAGAASSPGQAQQEEKEYQRQAEQFLQEEALDEARDAAERQHENDVLGQETREDAQEQQEARGGYEERHQAEQQERELDQEAQRRAEAMCGSSAE